MAPCSAVLVQAQRAVSSFGLAGVTCQSAQALASCRRRTDDDTPATRSKQRRRRGMEASVLRQVPCLSSFFRCSTSIGHWCGDPGPPDRLGAERFGVGVPPRRLQLAAAREAAASVSAATLLGCLLQHDSISSGNPRCTPPPPLPGPPASGPALL
jgi:hypothetical protein